MRDDAPDALITALRDPAVLGGTATSVDLVETHISWVLLAGELAYKIKKPVKLPFLDFTTLAARRRYCEEELRLNRRLAAALYLGLTPIGGTRERPRLGAHPAIEYAVRMRRFPADARLDVKLADGAVDDADIVELAELIGGFHAGLPPAPPGSPFGTPAEVRQAVERNLAETADAWPAGLPASSPVRRFLSAAGAALEPVLEARKQSGAIREGHGDLHLENLVAWPSRIVPFDALEFDPALRWIDVIDETAFVFMDLIAHERTDLAYRFLNRYLEVTGDYAGLRLAEYYAVHRALVRAKVRAIRAGQTPEAQAMRAPARYLRLAERLAESRRPALILAHGVSGSGKTTWTDRLIPRLPAVRLRSDLIRKQLSGLDERASSDSPIRGGIYSAASTEATYRALARGASAGLRGGFDVIVDAAFLDRARRQAFSELAADCGSAFVILDFHAPADALRRRIENRRAGRGDASEATLAVLDDQLAHRDALSAREHEVAIRVDTEDGPRIDRIAASIRAARC